MSAVFNAIQAHATLKPDAIAIEGKTDCLSYVALQDAVMALSTQLRQNYPTACIALAIDNSPAWLVVDLAAMVASIPLVPIPAYFSQEQKQHAIRDAGVTLLCTDHPTLWQALMPQMQVLMTQTIAGSDLTWLAVTSVVAAPNVAKITYTSGTTGQPKGVCLSVDVMEQVAMAIADATDQSPQDRHFCVLPLATLLENVAGVYASLLAGATVVVWPSAEVGFLGSRFDIERLIAAFGSTRATTAILIPELCQALVRAQLDANAHAFGPTLALDTLRFLAVGGAKVNPALLIQAQQLGLPLFEGYGLSESASVVTLNTPSQHRIGSIGKPLAHIQLRVDDQGELWVKGANYTGYTQAGELTPPSMDAEGFMATGDLGTVDDDGFCYLHGRKKNVFITSFGRNVSPEWVESALTHHPVIAQACVFGEAQPINTAVVVVRANASSQAIAEAVSDVNLTLPDYARIGNWVLAHAPFSPNNGQLTANGRLKRDAIWHYYQSAIMTHMSVATVEEMQ